MNKKDLRIVYLGTPDFATSSLKRIVEEGYNVVGVVTTPDKPIGRHQNHLCPSPVKKYAESAGLPLLQPQNLKSQDFLNQLKEWRADIQIVVAFRMLPEVVWNMPRYGTFNLHASLLPQYRGAAPINWAIINGERETGITTFFLNHSIDTGDIIDQIHVPINEEDSFGDVHDKLMNLGADLVVNTLEQILHGTVKTKPQALSPLNKEDLIAAPKIFRDTCRIQWTKDCSSIYNFIRGLSPSPAAWTVIKTDNKEEITKIFKTRKATSSSELPAGVISSDGKTYMKVGTAEGVLEILELQVAGKKRMTIADFLRGYKLPGNSYME